jgi:Dyp-type peroxidase family
VQTSEIQGNVVPGFNKDYASYLVLELAKSREAARAWLAGVAGEVATAKEVGDFNDLFSRIRRRRDREGTLEATWMNLAFTHTGLAGLGVEGLDRLPEEFRQGMRARAAELGDTGANDPGKWPDGLGEAPIHALMIVAADTLSDREFEVAHFLRDAAEHGLRLILRQDGMTRRDAPGFEHFGWRDGLSQPDVRAAPGEFILGDEKGPDWLENGSYLVFRRLSQDVGGFRGFLEQTAEQERMSTDLRGAKVVGRYWSGAPLVGAQNAPSDPGVEDLARANEFDYSRDPKGVQVPHSAHIRLAYGRDEASAGRRIVRRGIPYGPSYHHGPEYDRGLCFVCYQRSIADQFEFVQRALFGESGARWVRTTGGEYFFAPSISALRRFSR